MLSIYKIKDEVVGINIVLYKGVYDDPQIIRIIGRTREEFIEMIKDRYVVGEKYVYIHNKESTSQYIKIERSRDNKKYICEIHYLHPYKMNNDILYYPTCRLEIVSNVHDMDILYDMLFSLS